MRTRHPDLQRILAAVRFLDGGLPVESACSGGSAALGRGRLAGLRDARGWDLALGVVCATGRKRISILTPQADLAATTSIAAAALWLDPATGIEFFD